MLQTVIFLTDSPMGGKAPGKLKASISERHILIRLLPVVLDFYLPGVPVLKEGQQAEKINVIIHLQFEVSAAFSTPSKFCCLFSILLLLYGLSLSCFYVAHVTNLNIYHLIHLSNHSPCVQMHYLATRSVSAHLYILIRQRKRFTWQCICAYLHSNMSGVPFLGVPSSQRVLVRLFRFSFPLWFLRILVFSSISVYLIDFPSFSNQGNIFLSLLFSALLKLVRPLGF